MRSPSYSVALTSKGSAHTHSMQVAKVDADVLSNGEVREGEEGGGGLIS